MSNRVALAASAFVLAATTAAAQQEVGEAKAVIDRATASGQVEDRALAVGSVVYLGDEVSTDGQGEAQLLFNDGTRMVVGPNSALVIDQFVFRSQAQENSFAVRALGGAFRFISGDAPKDAYLIQTPAATIGVRGTAFDFTATESQLDLLLLDRGPPTGEGGVVVCAPGAECEQADEACEILTAERGDVEKVEDEPRREQKLRDKFPLAGSQEHLDRDFQVENEEAQACLGLIMLSDASVAPAPAAGPSLAGPAAGLAGLGALGVLFGVMAGDDDGTPGTPSTPSTPSTPGTQ